MELSFSVVFQDCGDSAYARVEIYVFSTENWSVIPFKISPAEFMNLGLDFGLGFVLFLTNYHYAMI